ncbi:MAG TPA: hypothetical protein VEK38_00375 [Candidatus Bathyarchaeia archaeon]|nr:hypothetical protein [Candidatus Bathyarchaeia archaeon]
MKKYTHALYLLSALVISGQQQVPPCVTLTSDILKIADGTFIDADVIEFMYKLRIKMISLIVGEMHNGKRVGRYEFEGNRYSVQDFVVSEYVHPYMRSQEMLEVVKYDFVRIIKEFLKSARDAKKVLFRLIEEDCVKRNRPDSLLLDWICEKEGDEEQVFLSRVKTFATFYQFSIDLMYFLLDLMHSCPKAYEQFQERVRKWARVKYFFYDILKENEKYESDEDSSIAFLRYVKKKHLDKIAYDDITEEKVAEFFDIFTTHTACKQKN